VTREQAFARAFLRVIQEEQGSALSVDPCNMVALGASCRLLGAHREFDA
jgi:hypothetical protein